MDAWIECIALATMLLPGAAVPAQAQQTSTDQSGSTEMKVSEEVRQNTYLQSKVEPLLPKNTDAVKAAEGFLRLDQFFAVANAAKNLGFPFERLKSRFLGAAKGSLDQAIGLLNPGLARAMVAEEVAKAETQASEQIQSAKAEYQSIHAGSDRADKSERPMAGRP